MGLTTKGPTKAIQANAVIQFLPLSLQELQNLHTNGTSYSGACCIDGMLDRHFGCGLGTICSGLCGDQSDATSYSTNTAGVLNWCPNTTGNVTVIHARREAATCPQNPTYATCKTYTCEQIKNNHKTCCCFMKYSCPNS